MTYDTVIRGGTLITPSGPVLTDLGIASKRIAAIGLELQGRRVIDATGKLILPGAIDPHVHLQMPAGAVTSSDDWRSGTIAAACGGTTTVIDFVEPEAGAHGRAPLQDALAARRAEAEGKAVIDYGLHMTLLDAEPATLAEIPAVIAAGVTSFKVYTTYSFKLTDDQLVAGMAAVGEAGGIVLTHAENDAGIALLRKRLLDAGHTAPRYHPRSRPAAMEAEAVERMLALGEVTGCPIYIVHTSTGRGADAIARARARGQAVYGETCPQYLVLTEAEYDRPGFEGAKFVCSPPLRTAEDQTTLWGHLAADALSTVGTDHCPFFYYGQKDLGLRRGEVPSSSWDAGGETGGETPSLPAFNRIPGGMPGIEGRLALLYTYGVGAGRLTLERWVEVCCTAPARILGLAGRKGELTVGADADVVIFDPEKRVTLGRDVLHENCDYTPYEGCQLKGYPVLTMLRGRVIARDGQFVGEQDGGRFLARRM